MLYFMIVSMVLVATVSPAAAASALSSFTHDDCPGYELLATNPASLGLDTVKQQSGYLNTPSGDSLFYWYFESRSKPATDPVVVWLNGGPGCSSLQAVVMENGPVVIQNAQAQFTRNPWSWNTNANVLYIDNPAQAGYSIGRSVTDTVTASQDFKNAIKLFFEQRPELSQNKLHIAGESYAGRYIPVFAVAVNEFPSFKKNVTSVMIGNGLLNPVTEYASYEPMLCGQGGWSSKLSNSQCQQLTQESPQCESNMQQCMNAVGNGSGGLQCRIAQYSCSSLEHSFSGLNPYDIRDASCTQTETNLCYPQIDWAQTYYNRADVMEAVGVDSSKLSNGFQVCNNAINREFYQSDDPYAPTYRNISTLLAQKTAVLAYNGDADIVLNWLGGRQWTQQVSWPGQQAFQQTQARDWTPINQQKRGQVTNYGNFTFLRVSEAGHMVPHDQPESAFYMVQSWLSGDYGFTKRYST